MQEPEAYNVLHIGPELTSPLDRQIVHEAKKSRLARVFFGAASGFMVLVVFATVYSFHSDLESKQVQINSLIDEVGSLSQANFTLQEQSTSQDAVLQSLGKDFTGLGTALQGGDKSEIASLFTSILQKFSESHSSTATTDLSTEVSLSSTDDSSYDVLILGTNGSLTDTIMVADVNMDKKKITLFSIPRDLYINGRRINEYYHSYGVETLERMVESVTGLHMDNYVQVDLQGFQDVVDLLGGLDIYVDKAIYDSMYPNGKGGYAAYSIEVGQHHMNGEEALKYARSRKSGTDFDRAARQQKVLASVRTKLTQLDSVMEMKQLTEIFQTGMNYTHTDLNILDIVGGYYDYQDFSLSTGFVLTSSNYLNSMINEGGAYILLPKTGNYDEIHQVISDLVN